MWCRQLPVIIALAVISMSPARAGDELTVVSWGGAYTKSQILGFIRDFEQTSGVDVEVLDYNGGLDEIRSQVRSFNVKWDVVDLEPSDALRACKEGLLEQIDVAELSPAPDGTPPREDFIPEALTPCAVGSVVWSTVIAYPKGQFDEPPQRLKDFFDIDKFPGRRGMRKTPRANLEWALMADGVPADRVYDALETGAGVERALEMLDRIKPYIQWWEQGEEPVRLLEDGRVAMTTAYNGRIYEAVTERGGDFEILWDNQIWSFDLWGIVKHTEHAETATAFVRFATTTASLANQARYIPYGPVRRSSLSQVDPDIRPQLPTAQQNFDQALRIDARWWAQHFERINERFQRWLERPVQVPRTRPR